jgi:Glycosyltransferase family 87
MLVPAHFWRLFIACLSGFALWWLGTDLAGLVDTGDFHRYEGGNGLVFGRDFFNFWVYGQEAFGPEPGRFYDHTRYWAFVAEAVGKPEWTPLWSYPPTLMLIAAPFGALPYGLAFGLWMMTGALLFLLTLWPWLQAPGLPCPWLVLLALLGPAALMQWHSGQNAFFFAAMLIGGYRLSGTRPALAGLLFGVLTLKPQLGLLVPVLLLIADQRRAFWWSVIFACIINGLSLAAFGPDAWRMFFEEGLRAQLSVLANHDPVAHRFMPSLYIALQLLGAPASLAMFGQACLALLLIGGAIVLQRAKIDAELRLGYAVAATLAATPYLMGYDFLGMTLLVLIALRRFRLSAADHLVLALFAATPLITYGLGSYGHAGGVLPMLLGLWWYRHRSVGQAAHLATPVPLTA